MSCIVLTRRGEVGSYYYRTKTEEEVRRLYGALALISRNGFQVVSVSDISGYGEYAPYTEIDSIEKLFILAGSMALNL